MLRVFGLPVEQTVASEKGGTAQMVNWKRQTEGRKAQTNESLRRMQSSLQSSLGKQNDHCRRQRFCCYNSRVERKERNIMSGLQKIVHFKIVEFN